MSEGTREHTAMAEVVSVDNAEHYAWGEACDGWHLVRAPGLSVIRERVPPGASEAAHRHRHARQFFFVLAGEGRIDVEGREHVLGPGEGLEIAPGARHRFHNAASRPVEFLVVSAPASHGDRVDG